MDFFISKAFADGGQQAETNPYFLPIMLVVFGLFFYFMIMRPQQKRNKAHKALMNSIAPGNEVLTNGGLIGRVVKVNENGYVAIELNENNQVIIKRDFIASVLPNGTMKSL